MSKPRQRSLKVNMKFLSGSWEMTNGGQVPVQEGTEAELRVPMSRIEDKDFIKRMTSKGVIAILTKGTALRVLVSVKEKKGIDEKHLKHLTKLNDVATEVGYIAEPHRYAADACFLPVELGEPTDRQIPFEECSDGGLWLIFEGATPIEIRSSKIVLPEGVTDDEAISLNHAFTLLSEAYEPWRKAHTGSTYERFFYQETNGKWYPLALLRDAFKAEKEQKVAYDLWQDFLSRSKAVK